VLKYDERGNLLSVNLDVKNPKSKRESVTKSPEQLAEEILRDEERITAIVNEIRELVKEPGLE
jgi:hypothetical protein